METGGVLTLLRGLLQRVLDESLQIEFQEAPQGWAQEYTQQVLNLYCPIHADAHAREKNLRRRFVLQYFLNGDWSEGEIQHFCTFTCCRDAEETKENIRRWVVWALLPRKCGVFSRKSWTSGDLPVEWIGLLTACHGIYPRLMVMYAGAPQTCLQAAADDEEPDPAGGPAAAQPSTPTALADGLLGPLGDAGGRVVEAGAQDGPAPLTEEGEVDWHKLNVERKKKASVWACRAALPAELALLRQAMAPGMRLLYAHLKLSSKAWETAQQQTSAAGNRRTYRVLEATRGRLLAEAVHDVLKLLITNPAGLPYEHYNRRSRGLFFCSLSSFLCFADSLLRRTRVLNRPWPWAH